VIFDPLCLKALVDVVLVRSILVFDGEVVLKVNTFFVVDLVEEDPAVTAGLLIFELV